MLDQPDAITVDGAHVWVANLASNTVTELNASNGSLVRILSGEPHNFDRPRAIAVAGSHIWVANANSSTVTELNASDGSFVKAIPGFAGPNAIATTSTGVWVTSDGGNGGASVIELSAQDGSRVLPPITAPFADPSGESSQPDAIATDGDHVWVASFCSNTVTELNASDGSVVRVLSGRPYGFDRPRAIAVAGSHVWVANANSSTVTELNASDGSFVKITPSFFAGPNAIATTSAAVWITSYGGNGGASVTELSAQDGNRVGSPYTDPSYKFSLPSAIASDGANIWVANAGNSTVTELSASNGGLVQNLPHRPTTAKTYVVRPTKWAPRPVPRLELTKGDTVRIEVLRGRWQCAQQANAGFTGIQGNAKYKAANRIWAVPSAPLCALIMKIGNSAWQALGKRREFVSDRSGTLALTANDIMPGSCPQPPDNTSCYTDNRGHIDIFIIVTRANK